MAILRSTDGKFYNVPDDQLGDYEMGPDEVKEQLGAAGGGGPGGPGGPGPGGPGGGPPGGEVMPQGHWRNCWRNCWNRNCWRNCH